MQITARTIDDFKTDRKGIAAPLQPIFRLVPIIFYLAIAAGLALNGIFILNFSRANQSRDAAVRRKAQLDGELAAAKSQRTNLETQTKKATEFLTWVDGSRPIQPLIAEIARSISPEASLNFLQMDRDADNPRQIRLSLQIGSDTTRQLDRTLERITALGYRTFSPQQTMAGGVIDYSATLLWGGSQVQAENTAAGK